MSANRGKSRKMSANRGKSREMSANRGRSRETDANRAESREARDIEARLGDRETGRARRRRARRISMRGSSIGRRARAAGHSPGLAAAAPLREGLVRLIVYLRHDVVEHGIECLLVLLRAHARVSSARVSSASHQTSHAKSNFGRTSARAWSSRSSP